MSIEQPCQPPFNQFLGIRIDEWEAGHARISVEVKPEHCNSHGIPHGGFICSLLDVACALPGSYCPSPDRIRRALSLSLNTSFVGQAKTNQLYAIGKVTSAGYKIFHAAAELYDSTDTLIASATSILKYRKGCEEPEGMPIEEWQRLVANK